MRISVDRSNLLDAVTTASDATVTRGPYPALKCVLLDAALGGGLSVTATNQEMRIRAEVAGAAVEEVGQVLLPADRLRDIIREAPDGAVVMETGAPGSNQVKVSVGGGNSVYRLYTEKVDDFPPEPSLNEPDVYTVRIADLQRCLRRTIPVCATESTRYAFHGVLFQFTWTKGKAGGKLTCVATDGRRLAKDVAQAPSIIANNGDDRTAAIIPLPTLKIASGLGEKDDDLATIKLSPGNRVAFSCGGVTVSSILVEGHFPPYEDVIPKECDRRATVGAEALLLALKKAALLGRYTEKPCVRFDWNKRGATLFASNPEAGEATVLLPCKYEGADMQIGVNPAFLLEAVKVADDGDVKLDMLAPNRPAVLRGGGEYLYVVMPVGL